MDIVAIFAAPSAVQSDNGREISNGVVEEGWSMWNEWKTSHGKPRHSQTRGSVERANQDVENVLSRRLETNRSCKSRQGLRFVQKDHMQPI